MKEVSKQNFGLVIAYLLPGLVALWGASFFSDTVRFWLTTGERTSPTIAGFLYVTLGAFTAGLTLGAIRTVSIDVLHHHTGVVQPEWDFSGFQAKFWAFNQLVESDYCLYQFYAHMCLALPTLVGAWMVAKGGGMDRGCLAGCLLLEAILLAVSRGTLKTYYGRVSDLLGEEKPASSPDDAKPAKETNNRRTKRPEVDAIESSEQLSDRPGPARGARW